MLQITLSREQVSKMATWLALRDDITEVKIVEKATTGIGWDHVVYFMDKNHRVWHEMDITDVSTW